MPDTGVADLNFLHFKPMEIDADCLGRDDTAADDRMLGGWTDRHGKLVGVVSDEDSARRQDAVPPIRMRCKASGEPILHQWSMLNLDPVIDDGTVSIHRTTTNLSVTSLKEAHRTTADIVRRTGPVR